MPHPSHPLHLTAAALALSAALAGCGGGSKDNTNTGTPQPPAPPPGQQVDMAFTLPSTARNVYDAYQPVALEVDVKLNGQAVVNNTSVTFSAPASNFTPIVSPTVGGRASSTLNSAQVGPLLVQATANLNGWAHSTARTLYIRPPRQNLEVLVPAYFSADATPTKPTVPLDPAQSSWNTLISSAQSHPNVAITAIINPTSGIFTERDTTLGTAVIDFKKTGSNRRVIGYVGTDYGNNSTRSQIDIQKNIAAYVREYPEIDGLFLDEMASNSDRLPFYRDLYKHIHDTYPGRFSLIVGNPGTYPIADYAALTVSVGAGGAGVNASTNNALVTFEGQALAYERVDPQPSHSWIYNKANASQAILVHDASCSAMQSTLLQADLPRNNTGLVYATNLHYNFTSNSGNPWADLPSYWSTLLGTVDAINKNRALPAC